MGVIHYLKDGLQNLVANLGTSRDKAAHSTYTLQRLDDVSLANAYRGAWLPRKIVDIPALDACRAWRSWQAEASQIEAIEALERRLNVREKVLQAITAARLYGGAAILIGTGDIDPTLPLDIERVGKAGIKYLTVLSRQKVSSAGMLDTDPASEWFDKPRMWRLTFGQGEHIEIHPSRLVMFQGSSLPIDSYDMNDGWGDSVLQSVYDACRQADATTSNVASLVFEAKIDVVRIPGLMESLSQPQYESSLLKRFSLAATGKGINGTLILDKEEEYNQKSASFATLPDIMDRFYQNVSGASDIPMTRLFGRSPGGLSSTGDSDMRNYYDRISAIQELEMTPAMIRLDECIIRSALGTRPAELFYQWNALWQPTAKEKAEIGKITADIIKVISDSGLYAPEAVAKASMNALVESGVMPGLEAAVEEFGGIEEGSAEIESERVALQSSMIEGQRKAEGELIKSQNQADANPFEAQDNFTDSVERIVKAMPSHSFTIDVKQPDITVNTPKVDVAAPIINVDQPSVTVQSGDIHLPKVDPVQVVIRKDDPAPAPVVNVSVNVPTPKPKVTETEVTGYDEKGRIKTTRQTETDK